MNNGNPCGAEQPRVFLFSRVPQSNFAFILFFSSASECQYIYHQHHPYQSFSPSLNPLLRSFCICSCRRRLNSSLSCSPQKSKLLQHGQVSPCRDVASSSLSRKFVLQQATFQGCLKAFNLLRYNSKKVWT